MRTATIYNFLLEANLMASMAILLMLIVRKCFRRRLGNRVIYFAWLLVAIRLLCPLALPNPAMNQIRPSFSWDGAIRPIAGQLKVRFADATEAVYRSISERSGNEPNAVIKTLDRIVDSNYNGLLSYRLMQVCLIGAALTLCWFVFTNLRFRYKLRADRIEPISGKLLEQFTELCKKRGVKPIPVYFTDPMPSACLVGVFRPYIALPLTAKPQEAVQVLTHEVCHYQNRDHLWALLRLACCVVHWFNPLVWLAADMSRTDCELACDDRVAEKLNADEKRAYASVLVLAAAKRNAPGVAVLATGMTMTGRRLKTRVNAILGSGQMRRGFVLCFALLACMALVGAFATAEYKVWPTIPVYAQTDTVAVRPVASEDEAVAYAKELWQSPYLKKDTAGAEWNAELAYNGCYQVTATRPDWMGALSMSIMPQGRVVYLDNGDNGYNQALAVGSLYDDESPEKRDELYAYALRFAESMEPGATREESGFRSTGEGDYSNSSQHFSSFYIGRGEDRYAYHLGVQVVPEVRIVHYVVNEETRREPSGSAGANERTTAEPAAMPDARSTLAPTAMPAAGSAAPASIEAVMLSDVPAKIPNSEAALAYAKELWKNPVLGVDASGAVWEVGERYDGRYRIIAKTLADSNAEMTVSFDENGHVVWIQNNDTRYIDAAPADQTLDNAAQDQLAMRLIEFTDSVNPGASNKLEGFQYAGETTVDGLRFVSFLGLNSDGKTYTLFDVQIEPVTRVVCYCEDVPVDDGQGVG